jgi:hypothetical protein
MQCSYDPATNEISYWYPQLAPPPGGIFNQPHIKNIINLSNDTYSDNGIIHELTELDNVIFLQISINLPINDELLVGLMKSRYYTTVFLPYTFSFFDFDKIGGRGGEFIPIYYIFSAICVPYTIADYIVFINPKYKSQITGTGNTTIKDLIRALLILPGLPISLLFYIFIQIAPDAGK